MFYNVDTAVMQVTVSAKQKVSGRGGGGSHHTDLAFFFTVVGSRGLDPRSPTGRGWPGSS